MSEKHPFLLNRPFWATALLAGTLLAAVDYWPIFLGRAPLPADLILSFPPWEPVRGDAPLHLSHAEMGDSVSSGYDFVLKDVSDLVGPFTDLPQGMLLGVMLSERVAGFRDRRLDLMNVKYFLTTRTNLSTANLEAQPDRFRLIYDQGPVQVFENTRTLPRAFLVPLSGARVLPHGQAVLKHLEDPAFDPATTVLLTEPPPPTEAPGQTGGPSRVLEMDLGITRHRFRVRVGEPAILVFSETDYPGWTAYVDGRRERLLRVDYVFKGLLLNPGGHKVEFVFESPTVRAGLALSAVSFLVLLGLCVPRNGRGRRTESAGNGSIALGAR